MCRWLAALGLRRKRLAVVASQRGTARVQALRETFRRDRQPHLPDVVDGIIAVDQSHADARSAQRTHGRARAGELAVAHQQYNGGKSRAQRISLIAAAKLGWCTRAAQTDDCAWSLRAAWSAATSHAR